MVTLWKWMSSQLGVQDSDCWAQLPGSTSQLHLFLLFHIATPVFEYEILLYIPPNSTLLARYLSNLWAIDRPGKLQSASRVLVVIFQQPLGKYIKPLLITRVYLYHLHGYILQKMMDSPATAESSCYMCALAFSIHSTSSFIYRFARRSPDRAWASNFSARAARPQSRPRWPLACSEVTS